MCILEEVAVNEMALASTRQVRNVLEPWGVQMRHVQSVCDTYPRHLSNVTSARASHFLRYEA